LRAAFFAAAAVLVATTTTAFAWEHVVKKDDFDGSSFEAIFQASSDGKAGLIIYAWKDGSIDHEQLSITWDPGASYICNTDIEGWEFVEWNIVDGSNNPISREFLTHWETSTDQKKLFIRKQRGKSGKFESRELFDAMMAGTEARFRFSDDCGNQYTSAFSLSDFKEAVAKINAPEG
jgi:hypothetical protein